MKNQQENIWQKTLANIKNQVNDQIYNAWFLPLVPSFVSQDKITLEAPNEFFRNWVQERYLSLLKSALREVVGSDVSVDFVVGASPKKTPQQTERGTGSPRFAGGAGGGWLRTMFPAKNQEDAPWVQGLNVRYTFENFVVGPSNRFAHAASLAVAESPAKAYNPLFIYGGVGLGKTHLMQAIAHKITERQPRSRVLYISSEEFTNRLISAIQNRSTVKFRDFYRNLDILLIDDIRFIAGKESTQEEFFHTFNALYDAHKQIVISSDRPPKEITPLEERLISRFEWGLVIDIQPPDFETRSAILRKKSELEGVHVPDDVLYFLAEKIKTNIRELEGALIRVVAYSRLIGKEVTLDMALDVLGKMIVEGERKISIDIIQRRVAEYFDIKLQDMRAKKRTRQVVFPRQVAMYLARGLTGLSLPEIGAFFGGRDHTTILHAYDKIDNEIKNNKTTKLVIEKLRSELRG